MAISIRDRFDGDEDPGVAEFKAPEGDVETYFDTQEEGGYDPEEDGDTVDWASFHNEEYLGDEDDKVLDCSELSDWDEDEETEEPEHSEEPGKISEEPQPEGNDEMTHLEEGEESAEETEDK